MPKTTLVDTANEMLRNLGFAELPRPSTVKGEETRVLGKKTVRLPKKKCERCEENVATRKDDHDQHCCEECWEEMPEWFCSRCDHEFRGADGDICPKCKHHPEDPYCPCGCLTDEEYQREKAETRRRLDEMDMAFLRAFFAKNGTE